MNLAPVSKAVAGAIVAIIVGYGAKYGLNLDPVVVDALNVVVLAIVTGAIGFAGVYLAPKNKPE